MSETVYYKGKLKPVGFLIGEDLEARCKRMLKDLDDDELEYYYESFKEQLLDKYYTQFILCNDILYSVEKKTLDPDDSFFTSKLNDDGTVDFEVRYYNGGCSFNEAIECAFERKEMLKDVFGN